MLNPRRIVRRLPNPHTPSTIFFPGAGETALTPERNTRVPGITLVPRTTVRAILSLHMNRLSGNHSAIAQGHYDMSSEHAPTNYKYMGERNNDFKKKTAALKSQATAGRVTRAITRYICLHRTGKQLSIAVRVAYTPVAAYTPSEHIRCTSTWYA